MITGNEGSRHKAYAELLGVSDYIRKPFAMDRLTGCREYRLLALVIDHALSRQNAHLYAAISGCTWEYCPGRSRCTRT